MTLYIHVGIVINVGNIFFLDKMHLVGKIIIPTINIYLKKEIF